MLVKILKRAKVLAEQKVELFCSSSLKFFLYNKIDHTNFDDAVLEAFSKLDDYDILSAIKEWANHSDKILSSLSRMLVNRDLLKIEMSDEKISDSHELDMMIDFMRTSNLLKRDAEYFVFTGEISNHAYNKKQPIKIVSKSGKLKDIAKASDQLNIQALSKPVKKYFICYPKEMN